MANHLTQVIKTLDFGTVGRRKEEGYEKDPKQVTEGNGIISSSRSVPQRLFSGNVCKLHGDMEHEQRKINFHKFDKSCEAGVGTLLICTDVASRGLDFKNVAWIV